MDEGKLPDSPMTPSESTTFFLKSMAAQMSLCDVEADDISYVVMFYIDKHGHTGITSNITEGDKQQQRQSIAVLLSRATTSILTTRDEDQEGPDDINRRLGGG